MKLTILPGTFAVCRLLPSQEVAHWAWKDKALLSITYTDDELSIVCSQSSVPPGIHCEKDWKAVKVQGPLDFSLTGILVALTEPLATNGIAIFVVSTFDTDYLLLKEQDVIQAKMVLEQQGHVFS